ncbi:MAG: formate dehydrogenase accessory sulfurtransferase FdhD [Acidobacteriota bacterium]|nr:MAG: formate dehydrogenase accessory sulfurtransferase FdhD [Acidobacteriota bacterium]
MQEGIARLSVDAFQRQQGEVRSESVAIEEPLEIRLIQEDRPVPLSLAITMRTPGDDRDLVAGFLFTEGVLNRSSQIRSIVPCGPSSAEKGGNVVNVFLSSGVSIDAERFTRNVYTTSSCGVCGKTSLEMLRVSCPTPPLGNFTLSPDLLQHLPNRLRQLQTLFLQTGGLHATGLFDSEGTPLLLREDVGRHNAMDKVVGNLFLEDRLPASNTIVLLSGRASFELVQKAALAGVPVVAAVGAPSTLAVEAAREFGMTLVGFLRNDRFNVYAGIDRIL